MGVARGITTGTRTRRVSRTVPLAVAVMAAVVLPAAGPPGDDVVTLTLVATNDFHTQLEPPARRHPGMGGAAYLSAHLDQVRAREPVALHVDAGDMLGSGVGVSRMFGDEPTVEAMNLIGLDVATVGNHEFDAGLDHLWRLHDGGCLAGDCAYRHEDPYLGATFTTLAANVFDTSTGQTVMPGWTIREVDGVRIGFVGVTAVTDAMELQRDIATVEPFAAVNPAVDDVVAAGADVVVVLSHNGSSQQSTTLDINGCRDMHGPSWQFRDQFHPEVDAVVDGHTHAPYVCDPADGPMLTQAADRGTMYTEITLTYDRAAGQVVDRAATNRWVTHDVAPDPAVESLVERYQALAGGAAPPWADLDRDSLGDGYEVLILGSDPYAVDSDGDGLHDAHEVFRYRTDPTRADTDVGGVDDGTEVATGTNPKLSLDDVLVDVLGRL